MNNGTGTIEILFGDRERFAYSRRLVTTNVNAPSLEEAIAEAIVLADFFKNSEVTVNANINGVSERICYSNVCPLNVLLNTYEGRINENKLNYFVKVCNIKNKVLKVSDVSNYESIQDIETYMQNAIAVKRRNREFKVVIEYRGYYVEVAYKESMHSLIHKLSEVDRRVENKRKANVAMQILLHDLEKNQDVRNHFLKTEEQKNHFDNVKEEMKLKLSNENLNTESPLASIDLGKYNIKKDFPDMFGLSDLLFR